MSERIHFESVIFLYIIALYTNWGLGATKGGIRGRIHPSSQLFIIACPWVILVQNTFI